MNNDTNTPTTLSEMISLLEAVQTDYDKFYGDGNASKKITTIGFLGGSGGKCKKFCDIKLIVPNKSTARIQECHIFLGHFIFEQVENLLLKK